MNEILSKRMPQLDGLRGVAIAMVLLFHYVGFAADGAPRLVVFALTPLSLGWAGVDLFFVLSGFLIGGILLDARGSSNYFRAFYARRVCRIFPLYFAFLAVAALCTVLMRWPTEIAWWWFPTYLQNFWMAAHNQSGNTVLGPTWSLAIEEQFYLTLPAVIYFVSPRNLPKVLFGGIVLAPIVRVALFLARPGLGLLMLLPCRMDALLIGVAAAYLLRRPGAWEFFEAHRRHLWTAIELLTMACLAFLLRGFQEGLFIFAYAVIYDVLALLFACVLVVSLVDRQAARILQARWLMALGTIAYGVYLIHPLALRLSASLLPSAGRVACAIIAAIATIAAAKVSWEFFEKPIVKIGRSIGYEQAEQERRGDSIGGQFRSVGEAGAVRPAVDSLLPTDGAIVGKV